MVWLVQSLTRAVEGCVTRLEELSAFVDSVLSSLSEAGGDVAELQTHTEQLERLFAQVDKLETFVQSVDGSVARMEDLVRAVRAEVGARPMHKIRASISSLGSLLGARWRKEPFVWHSVDFIVSTDAHLERHATVPAIQAPHAHSSHH